MNEDIEKVLEEFEKKFCEPRAFPLLETPFQVLVNKEDYQNYDDEYEGDFLTEDIKFFIRQILEDEKTKREEMAEEMIGEENVIWDEYPSGDKRWDDGFKKGYLEAFKTIKHIAKKYGVEV
jgi:hypothetical protein